ncbi:Oidioi.mRNA.OKI2018_I69.chr1.g117.t1.cds [Oikopleura dioica]|uniref:Oidioi.mRNA.OKI2018_I69.chr1.g117.t1.cds n=1 Tax=Oikopleura dioica TaxID=34765 RepID=A0ABN7SQ50_OIKDI|nr:Oidioi.mRNA.OKI2018_I69.chr1.g117.t1.cds [Oikopleura dioica]
MRRLFLLFFVFSRAEICENYDSYKGRTQLTKIMSEVSRTKAYQGSRCWPRFSNFVCETPSSQFNSAGDELSRKNCRMTISSHQNYLGEYLETSGPLKECFLEASIRTYVPADKKKKKRKIIEEFNHFCEIIVNAPGSIFSDCDDISTQQSEKRSSCFRKKIENLSTSSESQNEIIEDLLDRLDLLGSEFESLHESFYTRLEKLETEKKNLLISCQ